MCELLLVQVGVELAVLSLMLERLVGLEARFVEKVRPSWVLVLLVSEFVLVAAVALSRARLKSLSPMNWRMKLSRILGTLKSLETFLRWIICGWLGNFSKMRSRQGSCCWVSALCSRAFSFAEKRFIVRWGL